MLSLCQSGWFLLSPNFSNPLEAKFHSSSWVCPAFHSQAWTGPWPYPKEPPCLQPVLFDSSFRLWPGVDLETQKCNWHDSCPLVADWNHLLFSSPKYTCNLSSAVSSFTFFKVQQKCKGVKFINVPKLLLHHVFNIKIEVLYIPLFCPQYPVCFTWWDISLQMLHFIGNSWSAFRFHKIYGWKSRLTSPSCFQHI